jgi:septal ring factor EnvC (AmiA/AmiB activator)
MSRFDEIKARHAEVRRMGGFSGLAMSTAQADRGELIGMVEAADEINQSLRDSQTNQHITELQAKLEAAEATKGKLAKTILSMMKDYGKLSEAHEAQAATIERIRNEIDCVPHDALCAMHVGRPCECYRADLLKALEQKP